MFVCSVGLSAKPKRIFMHYADALEIARSWGYVAHDAVSTWSSKRHRAHDDFFSIEEVQRILGAAAEPLNVLWLAVETGMRAGELCGLRAIDFDFERGLVNISKCVAWKVSIPKK